MAGAVVEQWRLKVEEQIGLNEIVNESGATEMETGESSSYVGEVIEESENVKPNIRTHMNCPNCMSGTSEVIVRRKVISSTMRRLDLVDPKPDPGQLVGCLSCLSLFTCSENGCLNPFIVEEKTILENECCLNMYWVIEKEKYNAQPSLYVNPLPSITSHQFQSPTSIAQGSSNDRTVIDFDITRDFRKLPSFDHAMHSYASDDDDDTIITERERGLQRLPSFGDVRAKCCASETAVPELRVNEILKRTTVYRGLVEVIASLSVVAFAAAFDASTLSIILLALAGIIIGVFILGYNDWRLRDDCYSDIYFMLQAFLAIPSFLVLGMIPPVAYGLSFHETDDKDFTLMVVLVTSLLCVSLLAMIKAYINKCTVFQYFKTIVYYITVTVSVSAVSYIAGILLTKLIEEFKSSSGTLPHAITSSLASF